MYFLNEDMYLPIEHTVKSLSCSFVVRSLLPSESFGKGTAERKLSGGDGTFGSKDEDREGRCYDSLNLSAKRRKEETDDLLKLGTSITEHFINHWILDIDLDLFSTNTPFKKYFSKVCSFNVRYIFPHVLQYYNWITFFIYVCRTNMTCSLSYTCLMSP